MNRYTFVLPSENLNAFACSPSAQMPFQGHLVDQNFLQRYTRNFEIRRRVLRVKNNDEIQKEHTSLSLSISLSLSTSADPEGGGQGVRTPPPLENHKLYGFV